LPVRVLWPDFQRRTAAIPSTTDARWENRRALGPVDVRLLGATLCRGRRRCRHVDPSWILRTQDFDFFCRVRAAACSVMATPSRPRAVAGPSRRRRGRAEALAPHRPVDAEEAWRAYYVARNFFSFARRHRSWRWLAWHLAYSDASAPTGRDLGRAQCLSSRTVDGMRGRMGLNPAHQSHHGEFACPHGGGPVTRHVRRIDYLRTAGSLPDEVPGLSEARESCTRPDPVMGTARRLVGLVPLEAAVATVARPGAPRARPHARAGMRSERGEPLRVPPRDTQARRGSRYRTERNPPKLRQKCDGFPP